MYNENQLNHAVMEAIEVDFNGDARISDLARLLQERGYDRDDVESIITEGLRNGVLRDGYLGFDQFIFITGVEGD